MEFKNPLKLSCPFCNYELTTDKDFAIQNERVFCGTCCKSFAVSIEKNPQNSTWYKKYLSKPFDQQEAVVEETINEPEVEEPSTELDDGWELPF